MIKKNEEYEVKIIDNGFKGEGIAKIDGFVVFIPEAIKDEIVKIKILKVLKNEAYGKIIQIIKKSKYRVEADCETFSKCGGCELRHIKYEETLKMKTNSVKNILDKNGVEYSKLNECIGMENPLNYRNKLQFPVGMDEKNNAVMGVFAKLSHRIISTNNCLLQNKLGLNISNDVFEFIKNNNISVYDEKNLKGSIRHIYVRIGIKTNEAILVIVSNTNKFEKEKELVEFITKKYPEIKTVVKNINNKNTNVILGKENEIMYGEGYIFDELLGSKFKISPMSFYQVNPIQTEKLYSLAIDGVKDEAKNKLALDLYCGIGTIGICASKYFEKIYGIEIVEDAIKDAKENAKLNNIKNMEFYCGDVEKVLPEILEKNKIKPEVVFVDPPRKGLDNKTKELLNTLLPQQIAYISCNPATLARDLKQLQEKYKIIQITPVDMFPYTRTCGVCCMFEIKIKL